MFPSMATDAEAWHRNAAQWSAVGPPLRPSAEDIALYAAPLGEHLSAAPGAPALLLGVTPELAGLLIELGATVTAVDSSRAMIDTWWPAGGHPSARAVWGDWRDMPAGDGLFEVAAGDGVSSALGTAAGVRRGMAEIRRVMKPGAALVLRHFVRPASAEIPDAVFADLLAGGIPSFHAFKWRLAHALSRDPEAGVVLADIWAAWDARGIDPARLAADMGWEPRAVRTIDAYRGVAHTYLFPTLDELRDLMAPFFDDRAVSFPRYYLGDRCPVIVHRAR
jgi:SAM-dependent methyltransferase